MISWAVVGHRVRFEAATALTATVGGCLALDEGDIGAAANHLRAWKAASAADLPWTCVLEDDAVPVDGVVEQARMALAVAPEPVVSFYLGRGRPIRFQDRISRALATAGRTDPHWFTTTHVLHAVAVAIHTDLVEDWLDWAQDKTRPIDERLTAWCLARGHRVAYTWPSLFDHQDGPSLIPTDKTRPARARTAWRTGTRDTWTSASQPM